MVDILALHKRIHEGRARRPVYLWRRLTRARTVDFEGVRLAVDPARLDGATVKLLYRSDHEVSVRMLVKEFIAPSDRVIEGGAGMGLVSLTIARIVGADNIICYEPGPLAFAMLQENARLNGLPIQCRHRALGAKAGQATFYVNDNIVSSSLLKRQDGKEISVAVDGIADVVAETRANVLILDVEGAEIEIIEACPLAGIDKILIEIHPRLTGDAPVSRMFARLIAEGFVWRQDLSYAGAFTFMREGRFGAQDRIS